MMYYRSAWQVNKNQAVLLRSGPRFPNALSGFFIMKMDDLEPAAAAARTLTVTSGVCDPQIECVQLWHHHPGVCLMLLAL